MFILLAFSPEDVYTAYLRRLKGELAGDPSCHWSSQRLVFGGRLRQHAKGCQRQPVRPGHDPAPFVQTGTAGEAT